MKLFVQPAFLRFRKCNLLNIFRFGAQKKMYRAIYFNSANRDALTTPENFTITDSGNQFTYPPKSVKLTYAAIPFSWNNITAANNRLELIEEPNPGVIATVPPGNYSGTALATAVQTALNTVAVLNTYTVSFNALNLTFTIDGTGTFSLDFGVPNTIATRLGFATDAITTPGTTVTSTEQAMMQSDNEIWVCSDLVGGCDNGFVNFAPGAATNAEVLAVVPINTTFGNTIFYASNPDNPFFVTTQSNFGKVQSQTNPTTPAVRFFLQFPSGFPLELNGLNWSGTLTFGFD